MTAAAVRGGHDHSGTAATATCSRRAAAATAAAGWRPRPRTAEVIGVAAAVGRWAAALLEGGVEATATDR